MENNFNIETFKSFERVIVDFSASWCRPCKALNSILDEISSTTPIKVIKVDVDSNQGLAIEYGIRSVPTMIMFKNGELVNRITGLRTKEEIVQSFE